MNDHVWDTSRSFARLIREADEALSVERISVVDKPILPPSGDKHDYYSIAPYFWPDPDKPDGLPYIRRDGYINPEFELCDRRRLDKICSVTRTLALAYRQTGDGKYRDHAAKLLRCFFLDEATAVNPHLEYAQAVRGVCNGRCYGIIDLRYLCRTLEMIRLLDDQCLTDGIGGWMGKLLCWLINSEHGKEEAATKNNHGTWYDITCSSIALFIGDTDTAVKILSEFEQKRIVPQVAPDGEQPDETARARSFLYSTMNLYGYFVAAGLAEKVGIDIWKCEKMRLAFEYMLPSYRDYSQWKHRQVAENWEQTWEYAFEILNTAASKYGMPELKDTAGNVIEQHIPDSNIVFL